MNRLARPAFGYSLKGKANEGDRDFTDMIYGTNKNPIYAGAIRPTQLIVTLTHGPSPDPICGYGWAPEFGLRPPDA